VSALPDRPRGGIELLAQLEQAGAITETGLQLPPDLPWDQYEALAVMFGQLHRVSAWLIGDLLNYGEKVYKDDRYVQVIALTGLADQTCYNYASICKYVPRPRRRLELPFSVHAEVAYKEPEEQTAWLRQAAENKWTRAQLRQAMQGDKSAPEAPVEVLPPAGEMQYCPHCGGPLNGYTPSPI